MDTLIIKHKKFWSDKSFLYSVLVGFLLLFASLFINYYSLNYSIREGGSVTTDILLNNLPVVNTDIIFSEGALIFIILIAVVLIIKPQTIPFTLKSIALFVAIRAIFVTMTHLTLPLNHIVTDFDSLRYVGSLGADSFFSGHTGLPFLMALLFWDSKFLRLAFLVCSIVGAAAVILGHLHYTIDVFSAFFITHGIYLIAKKVFLKDYRLFETGMAEGDGFV